MRPVPYKPIRRGKHSGGSERERRGEKRYMTLMRKERNRLVLEKKGTHYGGGKSLLIIRQNFASLTKEPVNRRERGGRTVFRLKG